MPAHWFRLKRVVEDMSCCFAAFVDKINFDGVRLYQGKN
jgi:hypothetical protein